MRPEPRGTVTFLFTDVVGSTKRWERHRDAMQAALQQHDILVREAIESAGGYVFKTVGDAFCAAFQTADSAARAAADAQLRLRDRNWEAVEGMPVRMALHTGSVESRDGDYFGPAVNRVARLLSVAHGGQILVSFATAALLQRAMPDEMSLVPLGRHRLRDLAEAQDVYQLRVPGARETFPALDFSVLPPNNLPAELTSFVGGDAAVAEIRTLLETSRLVTLCGTGGVGKTRTALRVAATSLERSQDGVWLVELAPIGKPELVPVAIASALGLGDVGDRTVLDTLLEHLRERDTLLVLDNCEHVIEAAAHVVDTLLQRCSKVRLLTTSREPLRVNGETTYNVAPLPLPSYDAARLPSLAELEDAPAVRLFLDRARSVSASFRVDPGHRGALLEICRRVDGIPLALELAAARVNMFSVTALAQRLEDRFALLGRGSRNALPHHRTLRALIDWSFELLPERERALFRRLAVFAGGWLAEDAEAIVRAVDDRQNDFFPLLEELCAKSLVQVEPGSSPRFRLLETIRAYAAQKLGEAGEKPALERAHLDYFAALAARAEPHLRTAAQGEWLARIAGDVDNFRAALDVAERDPGLWDAGLALAASLSRYWVLKGAYSEGRMRLERFIAQSNGPSDALARALCGAAIVALNRRSVPEFETYARRAGRLAVACEDRWTAAWAAAVYSISLSHAPQDAADSLDSHPVHLDARRLAEAMGDPWILAHLDIAAAFRADARGDAPSGRAHEESGLLKARRTGDRFVIASSALYVAYRLRETEPRRAASLLAESASLFEPDNVLALAACFECAGRLAADLAAAERAATFFGVAATYRRSAGVLPWRFEPEAYRTRLAAALGNERFERLWNSGADVPLAEAVRTIEDFALTL